MRLKATALVLGFCFAVLALVASGFWPVMAPVGPARKAAGAGAEPRDAASSASAFGVPEIDRAGGAAALRDANAAAGRVETAVVQQGDSLWKLSLRIFGDGLHYSEIYSANSAQIRDPYKIYPGQILIMPK
jgi:nucleoid-associated protein YgaU